MRNIAKKQKIALIIFAVIIITGIIITFTVGFNFELKMQETKKIELYIQNNFEISDIKNIVHEVMLDQDVIIQKVEVFEDTVSIVAKEITEEQKQQLIEKVNEKYQIELSVDSTEIVTIPNSRGRDLLKPYIVSFATSSILILVYVAIRYRKLGSTKTVLKVTFGMGVAQALLFSIIAITRIPIGKLTIPMVIAVYVFTLLVITTKLEEKLQSKKEQDNRKSKKA